MNNMFNISNGVKKLLILAGAAVFLAAACNQVQPTATNNPPPTTASAKVDAAVTTLNKSIDHEESLYMQSDSDIVDSDQEVINGFNGVSNAVRY